MFEYFILGITFGFAAVIQPGPLQTYLISQTLGKGWRRTFPAVFAPVISDGPIIVLVLFILNNLPKQFLNILQITGGFFLLYLAYSAFKLWKSFDQKEKSNEHSGTQTLFIAVMVNILNPNPYLSWSLVMGPLLLKGWYKQPTYGITLIVSFYSTIIIGLIITIILASTAKRFGSSSNKILIGLLLFALALFAFYSLWTGCKALII